MTTDCSNFIDLTIDTAETYSDSETISIEDDDSTIDESQFEYPPFTHSLKSLVDSQQQNYKSTRKHRTIKSC